MNVQTKLSCIIACVLMLCAPGVVAAREIAVVTLSEAPLLDGDAKDWSGIQPAVVPLRQSKAGGTSKVDSVWVRAGVYGDDVYVILQWKDDTADVAHKPFVWDAGENAYVDSGKREDRLAIQFAMTGDYTTNWLSGQSFSADMWHWKAHRSNMLGLAHDKMTIVGTEAQKRAYKASTPDGKTLYIRRPSDAGDRLYQTKRYLGKEEDVMPKYILNPKATGSIADVRAKGVWRDGTWTLELRRKLNTGNDDDVTFAAGQRIAAGIAVFNHTGDDDHNISDVVHFSF